ncbi:MAG: drug/metabolite transporter (DMT)-like permease [Arenicella sp.]|jgi:drug/metabolite transporter (DMT)-like permease
MRPLKWIYSQPYLLLIFTTLFWAGNAIGGKLAVGHVSPFLLTSLRWLVASAVLLPFALHYLRNDWALIRSRLLFLLVAGTAGFTLFNNLMYSALQTTTAMNVAIIQAALPATIFLLNFAFFRLSATKYQLLGFPITMLGVVAIVAQGQWQVLLELSFVAGDLLMLVAMTFYGIYSVMLNKKPAVHWLSLISVLSISALVASLPFTVLEWLNGGLILPDQTGFLVVLYAALCASLLSQVFWIRGVELIGSNASSLFINLVPVPGTLLAIVLLDETLHWYHVLGLAFIVGGILLAQKVVTKPD